VTEADACIHVRESEQGLSHVDIVPNLRSDVSLRSNSAIARKLGRAPRPPPTHQYTA
jgi:hypothetical protein